LKVLTLPDRVHLDLAFTTSLKKGQVPMKTAIPRTPTLESGHPDWWHHHGAKVQAVGIDFNNKILMFNASAMRLIIWPTSILPTMSDRSWLVEWHVIQSRASNESVQGRRLFSNDELAAAFGIIEESGDYGQWLIDRYGAESAEPGLFIRWRDCLNIPGPGTGHDGDSNVSIKLTPEIKEAVGKLFEIV